LLTGICYIPSKLNRTKPSAKTAPTFLNMSVLRAGTKAARPYQRKNRSKHQAEIVAGMLHSPFEILVLTVQVGQFYHIEPCIIS
jgi:hypothetical protein